MMTCDRCHRNAKTTVAVQTSAATFWSPGDFEEWCPVCVEADREQAEHDEALRDEAAERRRDERDGF